MVTTHVGVFDTTLQKTHHWLDEISAEMDWENHEKGYVALRAVLHALRDRLPPNEAVHLAAELPMLVRGFYFEGWHPANKPLRYRHKDEFLAQVARDAPAIDTQELERTITTVFRCLSREMPGGEVEQARSALPAELRELWTRGDN
jgi:uncharacterized protein (DUF2267 family)